MRVAINPAASKLFQASRAFASGADVEIGLSAGLRRSCKRSSNRFPRFFTRHGTSFTSGAGGTPIDVEARLQKTIQESWRAWRGTICVRGFDQPKDGGQVPPTNIPP